MNDGTIGTNYGEEFVNDEIPYDRDHNIVSSSHILF